MEFAFTYTDVFVMVISMCLASRIKQVTNRIKLASRKQVLFQQSLGASIKQAAFR